MMSIVKVLWIFCCFNLALLFITSKHNRTIAHLMLATLVVNIAFPLYIDLNKEYTVYVTSLAFVLLVYNIVLATYEEKELISDFSLDVSREMKIITAGLGMIYVFTAFQLLVLKIYRHETYAYVFSTYVVVHMIVFFFHGVRGKYDKEKLMTVVSFFSLGNSLLGIKEALSGIYRVGGLVGYCNGAGNLGAILFPVLLYKFWKKKSVFNFVVLALNLEFTYLTYTRTGYIAIFVEAFIFTVFMILRNNDRRMVVKKLFYVLISAVALFFLYMVYLDDIIAMYNSLFNYRGSTQSMRFVQFQRVFNIFFESPFIGIGTGQYAQYLLMTHFVSDFDIHSQWLSILTEQGLLTFISYAFFYAAAFVMLLKRCKGADLWFPMAIFAGNSLAINFNVNQYYGINIYIFYLIVFGFVFAMEEKAE
ncbi:lipid A core-O-antigen ligase [Peptoclostridium acidaminophilum DSM 3953]|uniref:Lipid A core-O-antigen ligase n=1 Tax=Peptoclostridium acidaminophilum DSM 3953 TaxID=1286171 RepID=W8T622_PEPAC|nr:O-antigen ligase family protein [Peptoclostridium acidaminophilum]AHM57169.1 lipid A core-O-antigen ligase [Peptoclostridium acidaminophilum DSM 3953]